MINWGAVPVGAVLPFPFSTNDSAGGSVTLTGLAVTDIEVYKGTSVTQRSSDAGFALMDTDGIDIDSRTGVHGFSIDTGDDTDAGFYAVGSYFWVVVDAVTVDAQTVRFLAGTFRLVAAEGVAGVPDVNVTHAADTAWGSGAITAASIAANAFTAAKFAAGAFDAVWSVAARVLTAATNITSTGGTTVPQTGDSYAIVNSGTHGNAALKTLIDTIDDFLDTEVAAILAAVDTEVAAIKAKTDSLTFTTANQVDATVVTNSDKTGYRLSATGVDDIWDEATSGHTTAGTYGNKLGAHIAAVGKMVVDASSTTTAVIFKTVDGAAASATDDFYNGRVIVFTSGALTLQATSITDYDGATKTATVPNLTGAPAENVTAVIV